MSNRYKNTLNVKQSRDLSGWPVIWTTPSNAGSVGLIPGQGARIPHALWQKKQNIKQK